MKTTTNPSPSPSLFLGIDVGKSDLFCHLIGHKEPLSERFDNTPKGIASLLQWLAKLAKPAAISACLEQTGHYSIAISKDLHQHGLHALFLVNPRRIKAFGNQKLRRNKSDTADARLIARFLVAEQNDLTPWTPKATENEQLTELVRYTESITREIGLLLKDWGHEARMPSCPRCLLT